MKSYLATHRQQQQHASLQFALKMASSVADFVVYQSSRQEIVFKSI